MMDTIETERLLLRVWRAEDAPDLLEFGSEKSVESAGWKPIENIKESRKLIRSMISSADSWAATLKENGKVIGWLILGDVNRYERYKEVEFIIAEKYRNHGYATEALRGVLKYAFKTLDLLVITACHYPNNAQSKRVIEKCGFTYEGTLRKFSRNLSDSVRYSMLREEWEALQ